MSLATSRNQTPNKPPSIKKANPRILNCKICFPNTIINIVIIRSGQIDIDLHIWECKRDIIIPTMAFSIYWCVLRMPWSIETFEINSGKAIFNRQFLKSTPFLVKTHLEMKIICKNIHRISPKLFQFLKISPNAEILPRLISPKIFLPKFIAPK